ncbi:MAG: glycosyltransferase [Nitrospiraceae bacterium]|jgi:cellulose synthase/poly-beta-1,6-N-acetylglucosamine synthase-like glycosyltransferase|nr:glycosyltransferase [Nitrospiraceae bacterium]OQW66929.1 MAG: glycosyl transferase [Nitrospira sp. ST-bin5]
MWIDTLISISEWLFLLYLLGLTAGYLMLDVVAAIHLRRYMEERSLNSLPHGYTGFEPQITLLVPAFNEEATIATTVKSLLQLSYSEFEIVVINDGSKDNTLDVLIKEFGLIPFPEAYDARLATKPIRTVYHAPAQPNLRVVDKDNGGKADSLNAGINISLYPLFCCIDADSILQRDSLRLAAQPFLDDPHTIACGGTVRVANGCEVKNGFLTKVGLPTNILALFQIVEYLRAFLFGRLGWSPINAMLIISGAFGLFHKDTVIGVGGYRHDTIGEDMELVVRLHRHMRLAGKPYRITFAPDPICWTEAPEDLTTLKNQRIRWQRGLCESLTNNLDLLFHPKGGAVGWLAFPFMALFEWLGPAIEVFGYVIVTIGFILGFVSFKVWLVLLVAAISLGILLSVSAFFLEEMSFHVYPKPQHVLLLLLGAILENFGYRQLNSLWKLIGLYRWMIGKKATWGAMTRTASWHSK